MIFVLLLAVQAAAPVSIDGAPLGGIGRQALPARGCAAYLFSTGTTRTLAAMAVAEPAQLRIALDGKTADYPRVAQMGEGALGFPAQAEYRLGEVVATLAITVVPRADMAAGAPITEASLRIDRPGRDTVVMPLGGLVGCS